MDADRAKADLVGRRFGELSWVERTGSTNTDLLAAARAGAPEQVLVADEQTAGRGRLGRTWSAPPGASLLCSVLVREPRPVVEGALITIALGLAARTAVARTAGVDLGLKWPNDLVAVGAGSDGGDRKVAGMLAESVVEGDRLVAVVAGIGINVDWPDELPADLAGIATSLRHLTGRAPDRAELLVELLVDLEDRLAASAVDLLAAYRAASATIGRSVRVEDSSGAWSGRAVGVDEHGALEVELADGTRRTVHAADVTHLRPLD